MSGLGANLECRSEMCCTRLVSVVLLQQNCQGSSHDVPRPLV